MTPHSRIAISNMSSFRRFSNQILGVDDDIIDLLSVKPVKKCTDSSVSKKLWRVKRCRCGSTTHKRSNHMYVRALSTEFTMHGQWICCLHE